MVLLVPHTWDWYTDEDQDGFGSGEPVWDCRAPDELLFPVNQDGDCNDLDPDIHPSALDDDCDGVDDNCDGVVDDGVPLELSPTTCEQHACNDGFVWEAGGEECDEGYAYNSDTSACTSDCRLARCGDGLEWYGVEECDDSNTINHDGCSDTCLRPHSFGLQDADAKLIGEATGDQAGHSVSGAGDVNNDGYDDLLIGAILNNEGGVFAGAAYLVYGPVSSSLDLADADAKFTGEVADDNAGF